MNKLNRISENQTIASSQLLLCLLSLVDVACVPVVRFVALSETSDMVKPLLFHISFPAYCVPADNSLGTHKAYMCTGSAQLEVSDSVEGAYHQVCMQQ